MKLRVLALGLLSIALASPALAAEPTAADKETARALLNEGDKHFAAGDHQKALAAYRQADDLMHVPTTGLELAKAQSAVGQLVEAKESCRRVVAHPVGASEPAPFVAARQKCEELSQQISPRIPSVVFRLKGPSPEQSAVKIDGEDVRVTASELRRRMNPGEHTVQVAASGFEPFKTTVTLKESESTEVELALVPASTTATPAVVETPATTTEERVRAPVPVYAWAGLGVGGTALAIGTAAGILSLGPLSDAKRHCEGDVCTPAARTHLDDAGRLELIANVSFAVALVGGVVGVYGILTRGHTTVRHGRVAPQIGVSGAGLSGTF